MAHDVFISYASSDKAVADAVCSQLESIHRIRCWIAPRDVTPGASWAESIIDALDESKIMVLIFSSNANASMQIEREVERAVHKGINIVPLRIEDTVPTKTLEYFISAPHWLDAITVPLAQHIDKLAFGVQALLSKHGAAAAASTAPDRVAIPPPALTPAAVQTAPMPPAAVAGRKVPAHERRWLVPMAIGGLIAAIAIGFGIRTVRKGAPASESTQAAEVPSTTSSTTSQPAAEAAPVIALGAPRAQPAAAPVETAAAPATGSASPDKVSSKPMIGGGKAQLAPSAPASKVANFFIDFRNNISEGTISLDVDGERKWFQNLEVKRTSDALGAALVLPNGTHNATVTLLNSKGEVRDTKSIDLGLIDATTPRTLQIRLSRFKKDIQLQSIARKPQDQAKPAAPAAKPADAAK